MMESGKQKKILVTGGAGFIGSHLVESLLNDERVLAVRILDNLSTGKRDNIAALLSHEKCEFLEGDIRSLATCKEAVHGMDAISHQAALGSVPRSIEDPLTTHDINLTGSLNILMAAKEENIERVILACSSSTYGDHKDLPKQEDIIGKPLSPYALTKYAMELYADIFYKTYGLSYVGLRYFNVFGPRQDPNGPYAAVIPKFCEAAIERKEAKVNGDGEQTRDFTFVKDAVQANLKALFSQNEQALNQIYNVAAGRRTSLNELLDTIGRLHGTSVQVQYGPERQGDIRDSLASIDKIQRLLDYTPAYTLEKGLQETLQWFKDNS